jgi:hypothetical protein
MNSHCGGSITRTACPAEPSGPQKTCHLDRSKIIRKANDFAEWRDLVFPLLDVTRQ